MVQYHEMKVARMTGQTVLRTYLLACLLALPLAAADDVPADKRKAVLAAITLKRDKAADLAARQDAVAAAKVDPKLKKAVVPGDPAGKHVFPDRDEKAKYADRVQKAAEQLRAFAADPLVFAPDLPRFDKGEVGAVRNPFARVGRVVSPTAVVVNLPNTAGGTDVLLEGVDTSNMADGKAVKLPGLLHVTGNAHVGGRTLMRVVPVELTAEERKQLALPAEKK